MSFPPPTRRAAWWVVAAICAGAVALFVHSFVGTFALGLFVYYAAKPLHRQLCRTVPNRVAAPLTMGVLVVPALVLLGYVTVQAVGELANVVGTETTETLVERLTAGSGPVATFLQNPIDVASRAENLERLAEGTVTAVQQFGVIGRGLVHLTLALAFAFFLYRDGDRIHDWFVSEFGADSAAYAYLRGIDRDLEAVYFGNLLTVLIVTGLAIVVFNGFNLAAPATLRLPFPTLLALLTGLATFVPLVVGKLVYVPVGAVLLFDAWRTGAGFLAPALFVGVSFVLLDFLPQSVIRPYVSGRTLHTGLILFAYVLGTALFGWYGLFYGPLLAVVVVQFLNVAFPELVRGERVTPATAAALAIGSDPMGTGSPVSGWLEDDSATGTDDDDRPEATPGEGGDSADSEPPESDAADHSET